MPEQQQPVYNPLSPEEEQSGSTYALYIAGGIVLLALVFAAIAVFIETNNTPISTQQNTEGSVIVALSSDVFVSSNGGAQTQVDDSVALSEGDEVWTSENGQAALVFANGSLTTLEADTRVRVETLSNDAATSRLALISGGIWTRLEQLLDDDEAFEVRSGDVVTSVRGTEFAMRADEDSLDVSVIRGEVMMRSGEEGENTEPRVVEAGHRALSAREAGATTRADIEPLSEQELAAIIDGHAGTANRLAQHPRVRAVQGAGLPEDAGRTPDDALYGLERAMEAVATAVERDPNKKALRQLGLAAERLREAEALAEAGSSRTTDALRAYSELITRATSHADASADVHARVARAAFAHADILASVGENAPEEARPFIKEAINFAEQGSLASVRALAGEKPEEAFALATRAQKRMLRNAQERAVAGDAVDSFDAMRGYDRFVQEADDIAEQNARVREAHNKVLSSNLRTLESSDEIVGALSPGMKRTVDEVRDRSVGSQIANIATTAVDEPERAIAMYREQSDRYVENLREHAARGDAERAERAADAYEKYAQFGQELAVRAGALRTGEATVRELVAEARSQQVRVLSQVEENVPEQARERVARAVDRARVVSAEEAPPADTETPETPDTGRPDRPDQPDESDTGRPDTGDAPDGVDEPGAPADARDDRTQEDIKERVRELAEEKKQQRPRTEIEEVDMPRGQAPTIQEDRGNNEREEQERERSREAQESARERQPDEARDRQPQNNTERDTANESSVTDKVRDAVEETTERLFPNRTEGNTPDRQPNEGVNVPR